MQMEYNLTATVTPPDASDQVGFLCLFVSVLLFGTNYVPVKKVRTGDGVFFQFIMCMGIFCVGLAVGFFRNLKIYPGVMLGGFLWSTGNLMVVPIVHCLGLGLGMVIWASSTMLNGWAGGRFGFFGIAPQVPKHTGMNYAGVALCLLSTVMFVFIRPHDDSYEYVEGFGESRENLNERSILLDTEVSRTESVKGAETLKLLNRLSHTSKRVLGVILAIGSGVLYGFQFTPMTYIQDHIESYQYGHLNGLDFVFPEFIGIFATSSMYFTIYSTFLRRQMWLRSEVVVPAFISGVMWGLGTTSLLVAIEQLSEVVTFPIMTSVPSVISALLGVFVFKEIRGARNLGVLVLATFVSILGTVLTGLSKF